MAKAKQQKKAAKAKPAKAAKKVMKRAVKQATAAPADQGAA